MKIVINSTVYNKSLVDGPGIRSLLFMQGCKLHCKGCQNSSTWDINQGKSRDIDELADEIKANSMNGKLTISGGEPLLQSEALLELLKKLMGLDIALYTGYKFEEVPKEILQFLKYIKTGPFVQELKTTIKPYVGSTNQEFMKVR